MESDSRNGREEREQQIVLLQFPYIQWVSQDRSEHWVSLILVDRSLIAPYVLDLYQYLSQHRLVTTLPDNFIATVSLDPGHDNMASVSDQKVESTMNDVVDATVAAWGAPREWLG